MTDWLVTLAPFHDYGWFIAALAWIAAAVVWHRVARAERAWAWLPWSAGTGVVAAVIELASFFLPAPPAQPLVPSYLREDMLLGLLTAVMIAGWILVLPARRGWRALAIAGVLAVAGLRWEWPGLGSRTLVLAGTVVAAGHLIARAGPSRARWALGFAVLALWFTSTGPLAESQPRRLFNFGGLSALWSILQAVAAGVSFASLAAPWFAKGETRREWRIFLFAGTLWLAFGMALAASMSQWARRNFEKQALGRTKAAAALLDQSAMVELLREFPITINRFSPTSSGVPRWSAHAPRILAPAGKRVRGELAAIEDADADVRSAAFYTLSQGWIVAIPTAHLEHATKKNEDLVGLFRDDFDGMLSDWREKTARFIPPELDRQNAAGADVHARAPVVAANGRMLGWLLVRFARSDWLVAQAQPRIQAYLIVSLGLGLAMLVALQRVRTREHEAARAAAIAAREADELKTSFLAKVSHELRTPIQSVLGYSELLRNFVTDPVARGRLKALRQHGELMLRLVNDLLDLSAIQAGAFRLVEKPTALTELIAQTVDSLRLSANSKGLELRLTIDPAVPAWAQIDGGRVRQVLINLVANAIKFTDRGRVEVTLGGGPGAREVTLTVSDTGPGIAAVDISRLFRSFERLEATATKEGTGLGLALSAALCRGMNGGISVESVEGSGATFRARFQAPPCAPPPVSGSSGALPPLTGRRVLIADDNALVRDLFTASLREAGADCVAVADGELAVAAARGETFDAVVLDLAMPRLDGIGAARQLRALFGPELRIVGLSAHAGHLERARALGAGMDEFLVKPVNLDDLVMALAPAAQAKAALDRSQHELLGRLRAQFRVDAAAEGAALDAAIAAHDHAAVRQRAHHLMNSAAVVRDDWLFAACAAVERAAVAGDEAALTAAWETCEAALEPWTREARPPKNLSAN